MAGLGASRTKCERTHDVEQGSRQQDRALRGVGVRNGQAFAPSEHGAGRTRRGVEAVRQELPLSGEDALRQRSRARREKNCGVVLLESVRRNELRDLFTRAAIGHSPLAGDPVEGALGFDAARELHRSARRRPDAAWSAPRRFLGTLFGAAREREGRAEPAVPRRRRRLSVR